MRLAIFGATGRMGLAIARLAHAAPDLEIVGGICSDQDPGVGKDIGELAGFGQLGVVTTPDIASGLLGADVVIDFSNAAAVTGLLAVAARQKVAVVSGTTNIDDTVKKLGLGYDVEITEIHHRKKVDSPSGTAKRLADAARSARADLREIHGRSGDVGARGVISVTSNLYPREVGEVVADALNGKWADAERKNSRLYPLHRGLFA